MNLEPNPRTRTEPGTLAPGTRNRSDRVRL